MAALTAIIVPSSDAAMLRMEHSIISAPYPVITDGLSLSMIASVITVMYSVRNSAISVFCFFISVL